jgi:hypothetical protein
MIKNYLEKMKSAFIGALFLIVLVVVWGLWAWSWSGSWSSVMNALL